MRVHENGSGPLEWGVGAGGFVSGHGFSHAVRGSVTTRALAPDLYALGGSAAKAGFYLQSIGTTKVVP
jgi:hypothetical protein